MWLLWPRVCAEIFPYESFWPRLALLTNHRWSVMFTCLVSYFAAYTQNDFKLAHHVVFSHFFYALWSFGVYFWSFHVYFCYYFLFWPFLFFFVNYCVFVVICCSFLSLFFISLIFSPLFLSSFFVLRDVFFLFLLFHVYFLYFFLFLVVFVFFSYFFVSFWLFFLSSFVVFSPVTFKQKIFIVRKGQLFFAWLISFTASYIENVYKVGCYVVFCSFLSFFGCSLWSFFCHWDDSMLLLVILCLCLLIFGLFFVVFCCVFVVIDCLFLGFSFLFVAESELSANSSLTDTQVKQLVL